MKINIVGVPEHYNLPFRLLVEANPDQYAWQDMPGGTGDMCMALREKQADIAIVLSEGILKDKQAGNPALILDYYVSSPLIWGIHVAANSSFKTSKDIQNQRAAISRIGSGSHLMCKVLAKREQWVLAHLQFEIVANLNGAVDALNNNSAQYFLWEKFTTQYLVDQGIFRRIDEIATPWPCFVIAVRPDFYAQHKSLVLKLLDDVKAKANWCKHEDEALGLFAERYNLSIAAVSAWRNQTEWFGKNWNSENEANLLRQLQEFDIIT